MENSILKRELGRVNDYMIPDIKLPKRVILTNNVSIVLRNLALSLQMREYIMEEM